MSSTYADVLVVWSACRLLLRQPYLQPLPPDCNHLNRGSVKIKKRSGTRYLLVLCLSLS